jgi:hypothetical protein
VLPRAVRSRAEELGWGRVETVNGKVAVYRNPNDPLRQLLVPLDPTFDDYGERIAEAVDTLARFENRSNQDVLRQLLLPQADLLLLKPASTRTEGTLLRVVQAANLLVGIQQALAATAASVLHPRPSHSGRLPAQAEQFAGACLLVQAERSGQELQIACPMSAVVREEDLAGREPPFARVVTRGLIETLDSLARAAEQQRVKDLLQTGHAPLLSANLCEALAFLQPADSDAAQSVSVSWCSGVSLPVDQNIPSTVLLRPESFTAAKLLAPLLWQSCGLQPAWHVGFVEGLEGRPGADGRPAGEIQVVITQGDEIVHARLELSADDYTLAITAHANNSPVYFRGVLHRAPGMHRVEQVGPFLLVQRPSLAQAS